MKELISRLEQFGVSLDLVDENLKLCLPKTLERPELIDEVRLHKSALLAYLKAQKVRETNRAIKAYPVQDYYDLSAAQLRLYFQWELDKSSTAYNMANFIWLEGLFERERVMLAFKKLIERHEILRTNFIQTEKGLKQQVRPVFDLKVEYFKTRIGQVATIAGSFVRAFNLSDGPLIRVGLVNVVPSGPDATEKSLLMVDIHHIISDGISHQILVNEIKQLYQRQMLKPLRLQYKDFSLWQQDPLRADELKAHKDYWIDHFQGTVPVLNLPADYRRPSDQNYDGGQHIFSLGKDQFARLKDLEARVEGTFFSLMLGLVNIWLMKLSGQEDIVVGLPTSGRNHADLEQIIGPCINTMAIRNYPRADSTAINFLKEVRDRVYRALDHQVYPFEELVQQLNVPRDFSRNPLFDVLLKAEEGGSYTAATETSQEDLELSYTSKFDITVEAIQYDDDIEFTIIYKQALFKHETIKQFSQYLQNMLANISRDPTTSLSEISVSDQTEECRLKALYSTDLEAGSDLDELPVMMLRAMSMYSGKTAIEYRGRTVTYRELEGIARKIGTMLAEREIAPGASVGVLCEDRIHLIASMLAIFSARCIFVPLNTAFPGQRNVAQCTAATTTLVITDLAEDALIDYPGDWQERWLRLEDMPAKSSIGLFKGKDYNSEDPAYIYFTSGSTGKPKGIIGNTKGLAHFIIWETQRCQVDSSFRVSQLIPPGFDAFLRDVFVTFCSGATLCIPEDETAFMLDRLSKWVDDHQIKLIHCVPSVFRLLSGNEENVTFENLDHVLLSGEAIDSIDVQRWYDLYGDNTAIYNLYGPTETTMVKSCFQVARSDLKRSAIPIGKPIDNTQILILDKSLKCCPQLVPGEIYIRTPFRSLGYLQDELNKQSFIPNPFGKDSKDLLYKTGDFGRLLTDGNFEFLGRADNQVKLRGNRVELNEVVSCIRKFSNIRDCAVVVKVDKKDAPLLCAYYVADRPVEMERLRSEVQMELPDYMVPGYFCQLDSMPFNANGKLNKLALPEPVFGQTSDYKAAHSPGEKILADVWSEVLDIAKVGITDNFFAIGGDSIKSMKIIARLQKAGYELTIKDIFQAQDIERLAPRLKKGRKNLGMIRKAEKREYYPLSSAQKRQFLLHNLSPDPLVSNMSNQMELEKKYDFGFLSAVLQQLVSRHESLRTSFELVGDEPIQIVQDHIDFELERINRNTFIRETYRFPKRFDLSKAPLFRAGLVESDDHNILLLDIHHIISDGISNLLLKDELDKLLLSESLPPVSLQYRDLATWQGYQLKNDHIGESRAYWLQLFSGELPAPPFRTEEQGQGLAGSAITFHLGSKMTRQLKQTCAESGTSVFPMLLAVKAIVFQKLTAREDLIIGFPSTGRKHLDTEKAIGVFINTLALRLNPAPQKSFNDFLAEVSQHINDALDHQEYPFDELVEQLNLPRNSTENPLFSIIMVMQNHLDLSHITVENADEPGEIGRGEQVRIVNDLFIRCAETAGDIVINYQYNKNRIAIAEVERMFNYMHEIIEQLLSNKACVIGEFRLAPVFQKASEKVLDDDFDF